MNALIVEDDDGISFILKYFLEDECSIIAECCSDAEQALEALRFKKFDIIIVDYWLPSQNGSVVVEFARQIQKDEPTVVLITAAPDPERIKMEVDPDYMLIKPFSLEELKQVVDFVCLKKDKKIVRKVIDANNNLSYNY